MRLAFWLFVPPALAAAALLAVGSRGRDRAAEPPRRAESLQYVDATAAAGITFRHDDCRKGMATMMEQAGPGCALLDYDRDGWQDLYLVNGRDRYGRGLLRANALYRNNRNGTFTDVTSEAGVPGTGYGQGVAAGDYDNDGDPDLYLCQYGPNVLYRNDGGRFTDVTARATVPAMDYGEPFHTGAAWIDYDRDGQLDLFACGYVKFHAGPKYCAIGQTRHMSNCPPSSYQGTPCVLYRNLGGDRFENVTRKAGAWLPGGKALTAMVVDYNHDGWQDLYVGNDGVPSWLLRNNRNGTFSEVGEEAGVARTASGGSMAAMGLDFADYRNDGRLALFVADFQTVPNHLFEEGAPGVFLEVTDRAGIGAPSIEYLGFGGGFIDYDCDGWLDIFVANGHVYPEIDQLRGSARYRQHSQLFRSLGDGRFEEVTARGGPAFRTFWASRGAAWGDLWNRGVQDILVANNTDPPLLMRHTGSDGAGSLSLLMRGTKSNRDAIGARVWVTAGGLTRSREVRTSCSYLSSVDPRLHFGLGGAAAIDRVEVRWPRGARQRFTGVSPGGFYELVEGEAAPRRQQIAPPE